jgi:hypothetical protein
VTFTIDLATKAPISPYIYGYQGFGNAWDKSLNFTMYRAGGNRWSAYNWENGISHAGSDWRYQNDDYLCYGQGVTIANCATSGAVTKWFLDQTFNKNGSGLTSQAALVTIPLLDYVAFKSTDGDVCPAANIDPAQPWECLTRSYLTTVFKPSKAKKGSAFSLTPDPNDGAVYQDEYVNWLRNYKTTVAPDKKIFLELDNEWALWGSTHNRIFPLGDYCKHNPTPTSVLAKTLEYGAAFRAAFPDALIFGPVDYGWYSMASFQGFGQCDSTGYGMNFYDFWLKGIKGKNVVDVLDFHWYSEATGNVGRIISGNDTDNVEARLQAPRTLWDSSYVEASWITDSLNKSAISLIPRVRKQIDANNPNMGIAITEYNHGEESHISGALAEADTLGIFGREGLFAASFWPLTTPAQNYIYGAYKMYRNFDGAFSTFGNTAILSLTNSSSRSSVYASIFNQDPSKMIVVAINKTAQPLAANITVAGASYSKMAVYQLTSSSANPVYVSTVDFAGKYTMPSYSVSTLVLANSFLKQKMTKVKKRK